MVELARRETVVDDEQRTVFQAVGHGAHPAAGGERDLACVGRGRHQFFRCGQDLAGRRALGPRELSGFDCDAALEDALVPPPDRMHRHRVDHFVGEHHAAKFPGQPVEPGDFGEALRREPSDRRALAHGQFGAGFEDRVALDRAAEPRKLREQFPGQFAAARAELKQVRPGFGEQLRHLPRQRLREQRPQRRRGDEIACGPELRRPAGVVPEARRVEGQLHVVGEAEPAAGRGNGGLDPCDQRPARVERVGSGHGQLRRGA